MSRLQGYLLRRFVGCSGVAAVVLVTVAWLGAAAFGPTVLPAPWAPLCLLFLIGAVAAAERTEFLGEHTAIAAGGRSGLAHTWPCTVLVWIVLAGAGAVSGRDRAAGEEGPFAGTGVHAATGIDGTLALTRDGDVWLWPPGSEMPIRAVALAPDFVPAPANLGRHRRARMLLGGLYERSDPADPLGRRWAVVLLGGVLVALIQAARDRRRRALLLGLALVPFA